MSRSSVEAMTATELVARFVDIGISQSLALDRLDSRDFNAHVEELIAVTEALKRRESDRRSLVALLDHVDLQVRLNAAKATLATSRKRAIRALGEIAATRRMPQAADAAGCLRNLSDGVFRPT